MAETDFKKVKHSRKQDDGTTVLISEWTSTDTVECTDGTTLTNKLGTVLYYDEQGTGTITSQSEVLREEDVIDNLTSTATNKPLSANQGNVLNARIDSIIEGGGGSGDEEVKDIRIGADGTTYSTAGVAVRTQVTNLQEELSDYVKKDGDKVLSTNDYTTEEKTKLEDIEEGANKTTVDDAMSDSSTNPVQNKVVNSALANKVDVVEGKGLSTNDYTTADQTKLSGIDEGANKTIVDSALSDSSENPVQNKVVNSALSNKVDKVSGKDLSTNDYTDAEKTKLAGIAEGATKITVDSALSDSSENPVQNKVVNSAISTINSELANYCMFINTTDRENHVTTATVATSVASYTATSNKWAWIMCNSADIVAVLLNGQYVACLSANGGGQNSCLIPIKSGQILSFSGSGTIRQAIIYGMN